MASNTSHCNRYMVYVHRLTWFLQDNNIITKYQCGFQKGKSTTDHLVRLETYIRQGFVKNQHTVGIFFNLEKAYDTTWNTLIHWQFFEREKF